MKINKTYIGEWFLEDKCFFLGSLVFSEDGITLELQSKVYYENLQGNYEYICGNISDGTSVTVLENFLVSWPSVGIGNIFKYKFSCTYILENLKIPQESSLLLNSASIVYGNLDQWSMHNPFREEFSFCRKKIKFEYNPLPIKKIELPEHQLRLEIFSRFYRRGAQSNTHLSADSDVVLKIIPNTSRSFQWFVEMIRKIQYLLMLLIGYNAPVEKLLGFLGEGSEPINILYRQLNYSKPAYIHGNDFHIDYSSIKSSFEFVVNNWLNQFQKYEPTFDLYFGTMFNSKQYLNSTFLNLTQSIESVHRLLFPGGKYVDSEVYNSIISAIYSNIPSEITGDHLVSLKNRIKYGNEYSMRKRLKDLLKYLSDDLQLFFVKKRTNIHYDKFINIVVDTRNYYTHLHREPGSQVAEYFSIIHLNESLQLLLTLIFLKMLGVDESLINYRLKRMHKYKDNLQRIEDVRILT